MPYSLTLLPERSPIWHFPEKVTSLQDSGLNVSETVIKSHCSERQLFFSKTATSGRVNFLIVIDLVLYKIRVLSKSLLVLFS
ncbi:Uncharacterised protein [Chlamydia trachomatis]|nr:Uncharacterised protein [Chlamydia trachomatis]